MSVPQGTGVNLNDSDSKYIPLTGILKSSQTTNTDEFLPSSLYRETVRILDISGAKLVKI